MDKLQAISKLKELKKSGDTESAHAYSDEVLCTLLTSLGYEDVVKEYDKIDKWFA